MLGNRKEIIEDAEVKKDRVRKYLKEKQLEGVLITTREQFSWVTSGGDNHVIRSSNLGFGCIVLTAKKAYLVAHSMDADRLMEEQMHGQGYELVALRWYEGDIRIKALELAGNQVGSDTDLSGSLNIYNDLVDLHYPMTNLELKRLRWLATVTDDIFCTIARAVRPGQTEVDIANKLQCAHINAGLDVDVLIVGSDERCFKYRHPLPTEKSLRNYLMLHTVARRWGLHCNLTRFVHFGEPPNQIRGIYNSAVYIESQVLQSLSPGVRFADILEWQKKWYAEKGYPKEWQKHFQED